MYSNIENIHDAVLTQNTEIVRHFSNQKINIESRDKDGYTALHMACMLGHQGIVELLLKKRANIYNTVPQSHFNALHIAASSNLERSNGSESNENTIKTIIKHGANLDVKSGDGKTALQISAEKGCIKAVCILLANGATRNYGPNFDFRKYSNYEEIKLLKGLGTDQLIELSSLKKAEITAKLYEISQKNTKTKEVPDTTLQAAWTALRHQTNQIGFL